MKIYELPGEIQDRIFKLQIEAGNKPDASLELITKGPEGNFDWHRSGDGPNFWAGIDKGYYKHFYKKYPNALNFNRHKEILAKIENALEHGPFSAKEFDDFMCKSLSSFNSEGVAKEILKAPPINFSEHSYDEMLTHIIKVLNAVYA